MWTFFWWVFTSAVSALMAPKPSSAAASSLGDFSAPTAEEGRPIPYLIGTCKISGPNVVWWGDLRVDPIEKKTSGFFGLGAKKYTVGYRYSLGMVMALSCGTLDALVDILVGDKSLGVSASYNSVGTILSINRPGLFGGEEREGGISGDVAFYFGSTSQSPDAYLEGQFGGAPGYRGVAYMVLRQTYIGTSAYLKNWAPIACRFPCPPGFDSNKKKIGNDANAAYVMVDIFTGDPEMGCMGLSPSRLNVASFQAMADTLYAEGLGISLLLDSEQSAEEWLRELCRTVDAALYTDPSTGLWTAKLIRADYDPASIPSFVEGDMVEAPELITPSWPETLNKVVIRYLDASQGFTIRTAREQDDANRAIRGEEACSTLDFFAISTAANAQKIAARERLTHASPLRKGTFSFNRKGWNLRPGSPFNASWTPSGLSERVFRATSIRYGSLKDGRISVEAVEDVFGTASAVFSAPPSTAWVDPISSPVPASAQALVECPYYVAGQTRNVLALGARADSIALSMDVYTNSGAGYIQSGSMINCNPTGLLAEEWSCKTASLDVAGFKISAGPDVRRLPVRSTNSDGLSHGYNIGICGNEWFSWQTCADNGDGTYQITRVLRGIMDTVPETHSPGDRVWFILGADALTLTAPYDGSAGADGNDGTDGKDGTDGAGVPAGGSPGQVLVKKSADNYDTEWRDPEATSAVDTWSLTKTLVEESWDGHQLYRQGFNVGGVLNNSTKSTAHSIDNVTFVRCIGRVLGICSAYEFGNSVGTGYNGCWVGPSTVSVWCANSNFVNKTAYVYVYFYSRPDLASPIAIRTANAETTTTVTSDYYYIVQGDSNNKLRFGDWVIPNQVFKITARLTGSGVTDNASWGLYIADDSGHELWWECHDYGTKQKRIVQCTYPSTLAYPKYSSEAIFPADAYVQIEQTASLRSYRYSTDDGATWNTYYTESPTTFGSSLFQVGD